MRFPPSEIWVRTNRRALGAALAAAAGAACVLAALFACVGPALGLGIWALFLGSLLVTVLGYVALSLLYQLSLPRLAYANGKLLVYLTSAEPQRVPIEIVELFFIGQGSSLVPTTSAQPSRSVTVVIRLAEAAKEWHARPVKPALGEWREGYIILRGTWCEPVTKELVKGLNERLVAAHREQKRSHQEAAT
jgi:hypothetical protein